MPGSYALQRAQPLVELQGRASPSGTEAREFLADYPSLRTNAGAPERPVRRAPCTIGGIMEAFKHILIPTDFGEAANRALDFGLSLAKKFECQVTLLHAYAVPPVGYGYPDGLPWPVEEIRKAATKALDSALARVKDRYTQVEGVLVYGEPWQQILETAKARGADLVVMGTHGRRGLSRVLLGSVAERVVRLSPVPVLTVSSKEGQQAKEKVLGESNAERLPA